MDCNTPGFPSHHQLPELVQTHVHQVGDAIQPSHPLSSPAPPAFNLSQHQGLFQWISSLHQVAKVFGVSASASVLRMNIQDWFPLGWTGPCCPRDSQESSPTPQFKSINSSVFSFLYTPTLTSRHDHWKNLRTRWTFVDKVMSMLFNMLSRLLITFLPRSKHLLISWLQSSSAVILEPPKIKSATVFPIYFPWSDGTRCHDLRFLYVEL